MYNIVTGLIIVMNHYHTMAGLAMFYNALPLQYTTLIMNEFSLRPDERFSDQVLVFLSNRKIRESNKVKLNKKIRVS